MMCSSSRQEVSTKKRTCCFTPEFCYRPRIHSQLDSRSLVPPHPDYYSSFLYSFISCPHFLIVHKVTGVCAQAYCAFLSFFVFKLNGPCSVLIDSRWRWSGGKYGSVKISPCSISGMLIRLLSLYSSKLFCSQCFNKRTQPQNPCIPCSIGEF